MSLNLYLVGIGTGNPQHVTHQALSLLKTSDIIMIPKKGRAKGDLADLRYHICEFLLGPESPPLFDFDLPNRSAEEPYLSAVNQWHEAIAKIWQETIQEAEKKLNRPVQHISLLIWGDPSLYDSSMRIAERLIPAPIVTIAPGITSIQALAAAHKIPINELGASFVITTGRKLRAHGFPKDSDTVVIMLDGQCSFTKLTGADFDIWWGAYLGMPQQVIISGNLGDVATSIVEQRRKARSRHGWIMDTYLLRKCHKS